MTCAPADTVAQERFLARPASLPEPGLAALQAPPPVLPPHAFAQPPAHNRLRTTGRPGGCAFTRSPACGKL